MHVMHLYLNICNCRGASHAPFSFQNYLIPTPRKGRAELRIGREGSLSAKINSRNNPFLPIPQGRNRISPYFTD